MAVQDVWWPIKNAKFYPPTIQRVDAHCIAVLIMQNQASELVEKNISFGINFRLLRSAQNQPFFFFLMMSSLKNDDDAGGEGKRSD